VHGPPPELCSKTNWFWLDGVACRKRTKLGVAGMCGTDPLGTASPGSGRGALLHQVRRLGFYGQCMSASGTTRWAPDALAPARRA
jgi:hypothetical protein